MVSGGACEGMAALTGSYAIWYPGPGATSNAYEIARRLCRECKVRDECLADALANEPKPRMGFRGGMTSDERAVLAGEAHPRCLYRNCRAPLPMRRQRFCDLDCREAELMARRTESRREWVAS